MNYPNWAGHIIYLEKRHQLVVMVLVSLFAMTIFATQAVTLVKLLRANPPQATAQADMPTHPKPVPKVIASVPLFGNPTIAADAAANKNLPATNLQLVLRGVVAESNESQSSAVIEEPSKPALSYKVGDTLPGNAVLNAVYSDHVVLKRNGQLETLNFPVQSKLNIKSEDVAHTDDIMGRPATSKTTQSVQSEGAPANASSPQSIQDRLQQLQQQYKPH